MEPLQISLQTARRFVLGRQGLWPGRRWAGLEGTAQALAACEAVQVDPLNPVGRSHDLVLLSRVDGYHPGLLDRLLYTERRFFDYGDSLFIYPMPELPYFRTMMRRRGELRHWKRFAAENPALLTEVRAALRERGPLANRDLAGSPRFNSYRGRKDTTMALYYLWLTGELMIHHRRRWERVYDFRERVAPPELQHVASDEEAEAFYSRKLLAFVGLARERGFANGLADFIQQKIPPAEGQRRLDELVQQGVVAPVQVEGWKDRHYVLQADLPLLDDLARGQVPAAWQPLAMTTEDEVALLAPLDIVSARGRALRLFGFEYVWEVYKPAATRRWGYYTLPVLYGDRLVARLDPRFERESATLHVNGFWLEDPALGEDARFAAALAAGLSRLAGMLGAQKVETQNLAPLPSNRPQSGDTI